MSDPIHGHYRTKEEVEEKKKNDPILLFGEILKKEGIAKESDFEEADKRVKALVDECVEFAENSPEPSPEELYHDVYYGE
jgi:pyruvate dehydrogenase E1 component alpha subunit